MWLFAALCAAAALAEENPRDDVLSTADSGVTQRCSVRPLSEVVSLAISEGKDTNINEDQAHLLGLRPDLRLRVLRVPAYAAPDHLDHAFEVVYKPKRGDEIDPLGVLLDVSKTELHGGSKFIDERTMLVSVDGGLEKAAAEEGGFRSIERSSMTVSAVEGLYKREVGFYERATVGLPLAGD